MSKNKTKHNALMRKAICGLFLFIFFAKMVIALAPLIIERFDRDSVNAVIMQLEIEKESKEDNLEKEKIGKELWDASHISFLLSCPMSFLSQFPGKSHNESHRRSFYPVVPTPPPDRV